MPPLADAAVFIVRAWCEDGEFRARVSYSTDLMSETTRLVTRDPDEVQTWLVAWLQEAVLHGK